MNEYLYVELKRIKDNNIRKSTEILLEKLPKYFYTNPVTISGKYHPKYAQGYGGLLRHVKVVSKIGEELFKNCTFSNFDDHKKDLIRMSILLHDGVKFGYTFLGHTVFEHPIMMQKFILENSNELPMNKEDILTVGRLVSTHMGPYTKNEYGENVLIMPKEDDEKFVHMCDYIASINFLNIEFENNEIKDKNNENEIVLLYDNFENIDIDEEKENIKYATTINIRVEPNNKKFLFLLGMIFAAGKKINILNEEELNLTSSGKSFSIMAYVWSKLSDNSFPNKDFSNVDTPLLEKIENFKRLDIHPKPIENNPIQNKFFLICPVRNATEKQKEEMLHYVDNLIKDGCIVHIPHLNTVQTDILGGYTICYQNANAIATSEEIKMYYDSSSTGSVFDLGVSYFLNKSIEVLNYESFISNYNKNDFMDKLVLHWNEKPMILKRQTK